MFCSIHKNDPDFNKIFLLNTIKMSVLQTATWKQLEAHAQRVRSHGNLKQFLIQDPKRYEKYSVCTDHLLLDYSKNLVDDEVLHALFDLAESANVKNAIHDMFEGKKINWTENRPALHIALRNMSEHNIEVDGENITRTVWTTFAALENFVNAIHEDRYLSYWDEPLTDVINIGIGGSDLGSALAFHALKPYAISNLSFHFVSHCDPEPLEILLQRLDPRRCLFIVSSKSFTSVETMRNANLIRTWFEQRIDSSERESAFQHHFVAVSANKKAVAAYGINTQTHFFPIWEWVGGRYSLWSAIGLPIALMIGSLAFSAFLEGAYQMDIHFKTQPFSQNMPVILALLSIWYNNFMGAQTHAIIPYVDGLKLLPAYLQQLFMESNGKTVQQDQSVTDYATCPIIWGELGMNAQHAFFQLLHQSHHLVPIDFIACLEPRDTTLNAEASPAISCEDQNAQHAFLLASCLAQAEALAYGTHDLDATLSKQRHRYLPGNRPSNLILMNQLTPAALGALIALYEHQVFVESVIWNINAFDQWGVELGKTLTQNWLARTSGEQASDLINFYRKKLIVN